MVKNAAAAADQQGMLPLRAHRCRRCSQDEGMSIVEVILALTLFAIVIVGISASAGAGLRLTRTSNARQTATQLATREMELLRASPYGSLGLPNATVYETADSTSPDFGTVDDTVDPPTYLSPEGSVAEEIVEGGSLTHAEDDTIGSRAMRIYRYVTWVSGSGNTEKRVTVVVSYQGEEVSTTPSRVVLTSVFTKGSIDFRQTTVAESPLAVSVPGYTAGDILWISLGDVDGFPTTTPFFVYIDGLRFTVTDIDPDDDTRFQVVADADNALGHTNGAPVKYIEGGGFSPPGSTTPTSTTTTTTPPSSCTTNDGKAPTGSFAVIAATGLDGGRWSASRALKLSVTATDPCEPISVRFSTDGFASVSTHPSGTTVQYDGVVASDGSHTITARLADAKGNSQDFQSTVSVDTRAPEWPSPSLTGARAAGNGQNKPDVVTLTWNDAGSDANLWGYRIRRVNGSSGEADTIDVQRKNPACASGSCSYSDGNRTPGTSYSYTVVAIDKAENLSVTSDAVDCVGLGACNAA